jgi:hypothetical protein
MRSGRVGRYRIERELGRGSTGRVFLAHDPEIDRKVAIKTVHIFSSLPEEQRRGARDRFLAEVRAAGRLLHPGIVAIFDAGEQDGVPYLAMEYVEGVTLDAYCRPEALLAAPTAVQIVASAAQTLDYAHRAGIVHRDIKPANILRVGGGGAKIMDFGLAMGPHVDPAHDGGVIGTPNYMSPEQVRGEALDGRSDLFSLAIVLHELLTAAKPFAGETVSSVLYRIVNEPPSDGGAVGRPVPAPLARFLKKALAKSPESRYQSGAEFAAALTEAATTLQAHGNSTTAVVGSSRTTPELRIPPPPARRNRPRLPWVAVTAALLVLGAAAAVQFRGSLLALFGGFSPAPRTVVLEARVRTEPPGLPVTIDGAPIEAGVARFGAQGGVLSTTIGCRVVERTLLPEDAGGEVVLMTEPFEVEVEIDPGVAGAAVRVNGTKAGAAPARLALDLCRDNEVEVSAPGFYPATVRLPAGSTPRDVRTAVAGIVLERIPVGRVMLPKTPTAVVFYVDGKRAAGVDGGLELPAGRHAIRAVNEGYWIDVTTDVEVPPGEAVTPEIELPALGTLVVQAFPSNCKVYLRRPEGRWSMLDTTPLEKKIAAGAYELRVEFVPTGESREQAVTIVPGRQEPLRFSFAGVRP